MMKIIFITTFVLINISCSTYKNYNDLTTKIENNEIIMKFELANLLGDKEVVGFENRFIGKGNMVKVNDIFAGVIKGRKNDTIYEIAIVFKNKRLIDFIKHPTATYYRKEESYVEEYVLGHVYTKRSNNFDCIKLYVVDFIPIKKDTLKHKLFYYMCKIQNIDSTEYCPLHKVCNTQAVQSF